MTAEMSYETKDKLTVVLYLLMRDSVPVGELTKAITAVESEVSSGSAFPVGEDAWALTSEPLALLAVSLAERIV